MITPALASDLELTVMTLQWTTPAVSHPLGRLLRTAANQLAIEAQQAQKLVKSNEFLTLLGAVELSAFLGKEWSGKKG